jgi:hypothetical protein
MAQTISDNLKASLSRPTPVYKKTIELYRRAWSGSAYAYDTVIDITDYLSEGSGGVIMWKLDKEEFGIFNLSNVTLTFRNDRNQWKQDNPKGLFPSGKLINGSKIIIKIGAELADGTTSTLRSFTGYISDDPDSNPEEKTISMTLVSAMSIFDKKPAEGISTLVTDEVLGSDAGTVFTTDYNGVGPGAVIKKNGTEIKPTLDYTLSNENKPDLPLTVTLTSALNPLDTLTATYRYWYQDKPLEWIAEQIMTFCGITTYSISPVVYANSIENTWTLTSQAEWEACTNVNINTTKTAGSFEIGVVDNFFDGDYSESPVWEELAKYAQEYGAAWGVSQQRLVINPAPSAAGVNVLKTASDKTTGTWIFKCSISGSVGGSDYVRVYIMGANENGTTKIPAEGYYLERLGYGIALKRSDGTMLIDAGASYIATHTVKIYRNSSGVFSLYLNETLIGTATDNTYTTSEGYYITSYRTGAYGLSTYYFSNFFYWTDSTTVGTGTLESSVLSGLTGVTAWGNLTAAYSNLSVITYQQCADITIETATSGDGGDTWDDWEALSETGQVQSTIYTTTELKFRITAALRSLITPETPVFDSVSIVYYTSTTNVELVNMSGMTCRQVLDKIAEMPAYEMGFKADDSFVYRPRSTSTASVLDLRSDTNIKTVRNISDGADKVYNRVVAQFGAYTKISDASADTEPNSITKYGTREYQVSASNLLPAENVNLAYAVAPTILAYTKNPRRRCTVETQFILHLELGDLVTVYYDEPAALRQWKWGDRDVVWGQADLEYYNSATLANRLNLWGVVMRVEGVEFDFQNWTTSFDLVEVI